MGATDIVLAAGPQQIVKTRRRNGKVIGSRNDMVIVPVACTRGFAEQTDNAAEMSGGTPLDTFPTENPRTQGDSLRPYLLFPFQVDKNAPVGRRTSDQPVQHGKILVCGDYQVMTHNIEQASRELGV